MPELIESPRLLPAGSHCLSVHVGDEEGADQAAEFLAGTPDGQSASFWVADEVQENLYRARVARSSPDHVGCVAVLPREQVALVDGRLRPVEEVAAFVGSHPEGVTGAADTIDRNWTPSSLEDHLEYEQWFQAQGREHSRFLCPYELRRIPPESAPKVLRELGEHHSHVVLSGASDPAVQLLELFIFGTPGALPESLRPTLAWAHEAGLLSTDTISGDFRLTLEGERTVRDWGGTATVDW